MFLKVIPVGGHGIFFVGGFRAPSFHSLYIYVQRLYYKYIRIGLGSQSLHVRLYRYIYQMLAYTYTLIV